MKFKKILILFLSIVIMFIVYGIINHNHWASKRYTDKSVKEIDLSGNSVKAALKYAKSRSDEWHEGGKFIFANMFFYGKESIIEGKGKFASHCQIINTNPVFGMKYIICATKINFTTNEIVSFEVLRQNTGSDLNNIPEEQMAKWTIDIKDVFELTEDLVGSDYLDKFDEPTGELLFYGDLWRFSIQDGVDKRLGVDINPINGTARLIYNYLETR